MLRTPRLRKSASQPFICWKCLWRPRKAFSPRNLSTIESIRTTFVPTKSSVKAGQRAFSKSLPGLVAVGSQKEASSETSSFDAPSLHRLPIRERLRKWEDENETPILTIADDLNQKVHGAIRNEFTKSPTRDGEDEDHDVYLDEVATQNSDGGLVDLGTHRLFFCRGDLVEILIGSRREVAIFVREMGQFSQLYTREGRWKIVPAIAPAFFVPGFVGAHEVDCILPYLPPEDADGTNLESKQKLHFQSPPRDIAKLLLTKMNNFWLEANTAYQQAASIMDNAHALLAQTTTFTYATREQIADQLLSNTFTKDSNGKFSNAVLWALHRAIAMNDLGFRCPREGFLRVGGEYEIRPKEGMKSVLYVRELVRAYRDGQKSPGSAPGLHLFIIKARQLIDESRESREFTPHGTLGCSTIKSNEVPWRYGSNVTSFLQHKPIIQFFESWTTLRTFDSGSIFHSVGSELLQYIDRYPGMILDQKVGWTFMQEIGVHPPWQNRSMYDMRLPSTGSQIGAVHDAGSPAGFVEDKLRDIRKDWGDLPVFCIDRAEAVEIDDGLSIEATQQPDEYWIHVHTANPSAYLELESSAMQRAQQLSSAAYLPERVEPMLPDSDWVVANLSLSPKKPCITYSMKMNLAGKILEEKVTPGIVNNVLFLEPTVLHEVLTGEGPRKRRTYVVGSESLASPPRRKLLSVSDVSGDLKEDLRKLHMIAVARQKEMCEKGDSITTTVIEPTVSVSFGDAPWKKPDIFTGFRHSGDPTVRLSIDAACVEPGDIPPVRVDTVRPFMITAGEVAARWCHDRGIPIPYRITPLHPDKEDPTTCFLRVLRPLLDENAMVVLDKQGRVPAATIAAMKEYYSNVGRTVISTTAGSHASLGVPMYTQCTSPLRRFTDLLVQTQIQEALLKEARSSQSLIGNTREDFLPFSKAQIDTLIPHIFARDMLYKEGQRAGHIFWHCYLLLRAWKFGELALPSPLIFQVGHVNTSIGAIRGVLHELFIKVRMGKPDGLKISDIKEGDRFEVEIIDIDVYNCRVVVKALRAVSS